MYKTETCNKCKGTGWVDADIPFAFVPDCNNCSFRDKCEECNGTGVIKTVD